MLRRLKHTNSIDLGKTKTILWSILFLSIVIGCAEPVEFSAAPKPQTTSPQQPITPEPVQAQKVEENFEQLDEMGAADILFVIDNSGSMYNEQEKVGARVRNLINQIQLVDWQIGITTTDVSNGPYGIKGSLLQFPDGNIALTPQSTNYLDQFESTVLRPETLDCYNGSGNTCPSRDEQPLLATMMAITKANTDNAGFFRDSAHFIVIVLSDEDELSTGPLNATQPQEVQQLVNNLLGLDKPFTTFGIIIEPGDTVCFDQEVYGQYGTFVSELAQLTGGTTTSICAQNYSQGLNKIGQQVRDLVDSIELKDKPKKDTIEIELQPDFDFGTYSINGKKVVLERNPPVGTRIKVKYLKD